MQGRKWGEAAWRGTERKSMSPEHDQIWVIIVQVIVDCCFSDCWADKNQSWGNGLGDLRLGGLFATTGSSHLPATALEQASHGRSKNSKGYYWLWSCLLLLLCHVGALLLQSWKGSNPPALLCCALPSSFLGLFCILSFPNLKLALHKPLQRAGEGPRHRKCWKAMTVARKQYLGRTSATAFLLWCHNR